MCVYLVSRATHIHISVLQTDRKFKYSYDASTAESERIGTYQGGTRGPRPSQEQSGVATKENLNDGTTLEQWNLFTKPLEFRFSSY